MSALSARAQRSSSRLQNVYEPQRNARDHSELAPPELKPRQWHKRVQNVGHLPIFKWVPVIQQHPTEELQKGHFKKNRKERQYNEAARMTRSIRQQFDAPLEPTLDNIQLLKPPRPPPTETTTFVTSQHQEYQDVPSSTTENENLSSNPTSYIDETGCNLANPTSMMNV